MLKSKIPLVAISLLILLEFAQPLPADSWGCNLPSWVGVLGEAATYGPKGACCDVHDLGYAQFYCGSDSWQRTVACSAAAIAAGQASPHPAIGLVLELLPCYDPCDWVNVLAARCFVSDDFFPGPSNCLWGGSPPRLGCNVCHRPRNPTNPFGCVDHCQCGAGQVCDFGTGNCYFLPPPDPCDEVIRPVP